MDPISNVDRLVLLLRKRLLERSRLTPGKGREAKAEQPLGGKAQLHALAAVDSVDDGQLKRALIQNILAENLGDKLLNEAKFHQVVDRVTETIDADPNAAPLLASLVRQLRASAG